MEVEIVIDPACREPKLVIHTAELTPEVVNLSQKLGKGAKALAGWREGEVFLLEPEEIRSIYSQGGRVLAAAGGDVFQMKSRLYELEEQLEGTAFQRISNTEIVNFEMVKSLDLSISGTISLRFKSGETTFVSRRYVGRIKEHLGL